MAENQAEYKTGGEPVKLRRRIDEAWYFLESMRQRSGSIRLLLIACGARRVWQYEAVIWILEGGGWRCTIEIKPSFAEAEAWLVEQLGAVVEESE